MEQNKTAASPSYMGEYNFDQFKRKVRPGQIWQTANSLIRVDKLVGNVLTRRMSRYLKFYGAFTGTSPRAIKTLMPQKNGKFLSSSGPWLVSRKYESFLLLKEGVFEGIPEFDSRKTINQNPATDGSFSGKSPTDPNSAQELAQIDTSLENPEELELNLPSIRADLASTVFEAETVTALITACQEAYRDFDGTWAMHPGHDNVMSQAFNIKVQRLNIPEFAREALGNRLNDIYESYTYFTVDDYCKQLPLIFGWVKQVYTTGRSGGWLEVEIDISKLFDNYVGDYTPSEKADEFVDNAIESQYGFMYSEGEELSAIEIQELVTYLQKLLPAIKRATLRLKKLEKNVKAEYQSYINTMESDEFWRDEIANRG